MANVRTDFSAGVEWGRRAQQAIAMGLTAAMAEAQSIATAGMVGAQNSVTQRISKTGIEYYTGKGSPIGEYPGKRTGTLERSMSVERAQPRQGVVTGYFRASAEYAAFVHGTQQRPRRPFLLLPFNRNRDRIMRAFVRTISRGLA